MNPRILAIDDESRWLSNYKAWIPLEVAMQDSASNTLEAINYLQKRRYDVVLLDLSMDINDPSNRDNRAIQEYLATRSDYTLYIIISGTARKTEVRDSAFHLNAYDVIFKEEIEPTRLRERVAQAIHETSKHNKEMVADAKRQLTDRGRLDDPILATVKPRGGNNSLYPLMETLFGRIAPVAVHKDRPLFVIWQECVVALVWSRQLGVAVSILLTNAGIPKEEAHQRLADWLGFPPGDRTVYSKETDRVRVEIFEEPDISDMQFALPLISPSAG